MFTAQWKHRTEQQKTGLILKNVPDAFTLAHMILGLLSPNFTRKVLQLGSGVSQKLEVNKTLT